DDATHGGYHRSITRQNRRSINRYDFLYLPEPNEYGGQALVRDVGIAPARLTRPYPKWFESHPGANRQNESRAANTWHSQQKTHAPEDAENQSRAPTGFADRLGKI